MDVCLLWVLSGRGLCDGLITRPEESYRMWCVYDREASKMTRPRPIRGCCVMGKNYNIIIIIIITLKYLRFKIRSSLCGPVINH
jgi:hypothetical protein